MSGLSGTQSLAQQGLNSATKLASSFGQAALQLKLAELDAEEKVGKKLAAATDAAQKAVDKGQMDGNDAQEFVRSFSKKLSGVNQSNGKSISDESLSCTQSL